MKTVVGWTGQSVEGRDGWCKPSRQDGTVQYSANCFFMTDRDNECLCSRQDEPVLLFGRRDGTAHRFESARRDSKTIAFLVVTG